MDLAFIDLMATKGDSLLHQCSTISKLFFIICALSSIVLTNRPLQLLPVFFLLIIGYSLGKISVQKMFHYTFYPVFFSLIFALLRFTVSFSDGMLIILKAVAAALTLLLFIMTTPYSELFSLMTRFLPGILVEGMFFTYRIFFILIREVKNFLIYIKIKGGYSPSRILFNVKNLVGGIGVIFIHAFDLGERMQQILTIRGYAGFVRTDLVLTLNFIDYLIILTGLVAIILVVMI